jgi:2',3'-cyclic-nucleotide 2'-phosphodiesterase (5'-nucleotidase family)
VKSAAVAPLLGLVLLVVAGVGLARPLTILYTNDLHLRLERLKAVGRLIEEDRSGADPILLVDAGDALQDFRTPLAAVWGADEMVDWMNRVGYDAMALGNHEMYWGPDRLEELAARAEYPILCANLIAAPGHVAPFVPAVVREVGGMRILLVGVITPFHLPYPDFPWLRYEAPEVALERTLAELGEKVDLVVAVGHIPVADAARAAEAVRGIDVFVTGHSHETTPAPVRAGGTSIVQAGAFGRYLGRLRLDVDGGVATVVANELLPTDEASVRQDRGLRQLVAVAVVFLASALLVLL